MSESVGASLPGAAPLVEYPATDACATTGTPRFHRICRCETYPDNWGACAEFVLGGNGLCAACDHAAVCHRVLGATGRFPEGQLGSGDEGELRFAVGHDGGKQLVTVEFGKMVGWLALSPQIARQMAEALLRH